MKRYSELRLAMAALFLLTVLERTAAAHPHDADGEENDVDASEPAAEAEGGHGTVPGIGETRPLRFVDRRQILFRIGFGGKYEDAILGDSAAAPTFGATLRWDRPVHEYITTGLGFSFYTAKSKEERFYEPAFDIDYVLKGRYPFHMGKREKKLEAEVYLLTHVGLTIWIDSNSPTLDFLGPGWNIGLSPGFQFFINSRIGLLAEVGWIRTEAVFSSGRFTIILNQAVARIGPVFSF